MNSDDMKCIYCDAELFLYDTDENWKKYKCTLCGSTFIHFRSGSDTWNMSPVAKLIGSLKSEIITLQDTVEKMANFISFDDIDTDICEHTKDKFCNSTDHVVDNCYKCIINYFKNL